jgi:hypothetical protein
LPKNERQNLKKPSRVTIATPKTYELIGRISTSAAELEFVTIFCAKLADIKNEIDVEETLSSRNEVIRLTRAAFQNLEESGKVTDLPNINSFLRRLRKLLNKRDALVHGYLMHKDDQGLKMYQPRKKKWADIDDGSLEELLIDFQKLSDEVLELRSYVWEQLHPSGLVQLGLNMDANKGKGTRLN